MHKEILFGICLIITSLSILIFVLMFLDLCHNIAFATPSTLGNPELKVDSITSRLSSRTRMAFIDDRNILVFRKK
jgi:hypothetical protein